MTFEYNIFKVAIVVEPRKPVSDFSVINHFDEWKYGKYFNPEQDLVPDLHQLQTDCRVVFNKLKQCYDDYSVTISISKYMILSIIKEGRGEHIKRSFIIMDVEPNFSILDTNSPYMSPVLLSDSDITRHCCVDDIQK